MIYSFDATQILHVNRLKHVKIPIDDPPAHRDLRITLKDRSYDVQRLSSTLREHIKSVHTYARSIFDRLKVFKEDPSAPGRTLKLSHQRRQYRARSQNKRQPYATISLLVCDPVSYPKGGPR